MHPFTITNAITAALTRIERARGFLEGARLSEEWLSGMQARALVLEAHYTTHIEGTRLTLDQSEKLLAGKRLPGIDPDDARELLNYRDAFELVSDYLGSGEPVTEGLIREIHKRPFIILNSKPPVLHRELDSDSLSARKSMAQCQHILPDEILSFGLNFGQLGA